MGFLLIFPMTVFNFIKVIKLEAPAYLLSINFMFLYFTAIQQKTSIIEISVLK